MPARPIAPAAASPIARSPKNTASWAIISPSATESINGAEKRTYSRIVARS